MILDQEARELKRRKQIVAQEIEWASRGVKARVKRNIRRLLKVKEMRENLQSDEASFRRATKTISLSPIQNFENNSQF